MSDDPICTGCDDPIYPEHHHSACPGCDDEYHEGCWQYGETFKCAHCEERYCDNCISEHETNCFAETMA